MQTTTETTMRWRNVVRLFSRSRRMLLGTILSLLLGGIVLQQWQSRMDAIATAEKTTRTLTDLLAQRISSDFDRLDALLAFASTEFQPDALAAMPPARRAAEGKRLARLTGEFPELGGAFIFNADGLLILSSIPDQKVFSIADRQHFQVLRDNPLLTTVFSNPQISRSTGKPAIVQSKAIRDASGRFLGIANAIFHLENLNLQIANLGMGHGISALLRRSDNFKLVARFPRGRESDFGEALPDGNPIRAHIESGDQAGSLEYIASTDGIARIGSFKVLPHQPFYVQVASKKAEFLAAWTRQTLVLVGVFGLLGIPALLLLIRLERATARERVSQQALLSHQQRLEKISRNVPGVIYQFQRWPDGKSAFPYASEGIRNIYSVSPQAVQEDASPVYATLHPEDLERVAQRIIESANALSLWQDEYRVVRPDGEVIWVEGHASPEQQDDGSVLWHGYIFDISARKHVQLELENYRNRLEQIVDMRTADLMVAKEAAEAANHAKSTFLSIASHELRTPMSGVMGILALIKKKTDNPQILDYIDKADRASRQLLSVINDILDISRIESNRLTLAASEFHFEEIRANVLDALGDMARSKGLLLRYPEHGNLDSQTFIGDPTRLTQILINLVGNAIKFSQEGEISVTVRELGEAPAGRKKIQLEVRDSGIGIPPEKQAAIFEPFEQVDSSTSRQYGGTGLGLALCRRLVKAMGGEIGVQSEPGHGSTFRVELALEAAPERDTARTGINLAADTLQSRHQGASVLVVEDDPLNQEIAQALLEDVGMNVFIASDGLEAVECARSGSFDLILMDVKMPNMDGIQATYEIRSIAAHATTPIIAMTANIFDTDRDACFKAGMNDHIGKPATPEVLYACILKWLDKAGHKKYPH